MSNAIRMNKLQIKEQQRINRERVQQSEQGEHKRDGLIAKQRARYDHVASHGYGVSGGVDANNMDEYDYSEAPDYGNRGGDAYRANPRTVAAAAPQPVGRRVQQDREFDIARGPAAGRGAAPVSRGRAQGTSSGSPNDVEIHVYVRECDGKGAKTFSFFEQDALQEQWNDEDGGGRGEGLHQYHHHQPQPQQREVNPRAAVNTRQRGGAGGPPPRRVSNDRNVDYDDGRGTRPRVAPPPAARGSNGILPAVGRRTTDEPYRKSSVTSQQTDADDGGARQRGKVPGYILKRKAELQAEKDATEAEIGRQRERAQCPPGHRLVPDSEKAAVLAEVAQRKGEIEKEFNRLPMRYDTEAIKRRRRMLEEELCQLEETEKKFKTTRQLYVPID